LLTDESKKIKVKLGELVGMFPDFEKELRRVGVNRWVLWEEYKQNHPIGVYFYSLESSKCKITKKMLLLR